MNGHWRRLPYITLLIVASSAFAQIPSAGGPAVEAPVTTAVGGTESGPAGSTESALSPPLVGHSPEESTPADVSAATGPAETSPKSTKEPPDVIGDSYDCGFEQADDFNLDAWPDGWKRVIGNGYPHWVKVKSVACDASQGEQALRVEVNGASAKLLSPRIPFDPKHSYLLSIDVRALEVSDCELQVTLNVVDARGKTLSSFSKPIARPGGTWQTVEVGPCSCKDPRATGYVILVEAKIHNRAELKGSIDFDRLFVRRLALMEVRCANGRTYMTTPEDAELHCLVSGEIPQGSTLAWRVFDAYGKALDEKRFSLEDLQEFAVQPPVRRHGPRLFPVSALRATEFAVKTRRSPGAEAATSGTSNPAAVGPMPPVDSPAHPPAAGQETHAGQAGVPSATQSYEVVWRPRVENFGYFEVECVLTLSNGEVQKRRTAFVVMPGLEAVSSGEFGWTIPPDSHRLNLVELADLLRESGVHWVKYPVWLENKDGAFEALIPFADDLETNGIQLVGLLQTPPPGLLAKYGAGRHEISAAEVFSPAPAVWGPWLTPVLSKLSMRIRSWQLGADNDYSFVSSSQAASILQSVRDQLGGNRVLVRLGVAWRWHYEVPEVEPAPWDFLVFGDDPDLTAAELIQHLSEAQTAPTAWVSLQPLSRKMYPLDLRVADLVLRMAASRTRNAEACFVPDPFSEEFGIVRPDGSPGPLFLPWRQTCQHLSAREYEGSLPLPNGSGNHVFSSGQDAVIVVWNDSPTTEHAYLGKDVLQQNVWGEQTPVKVNASGLQEFEVGPVPTFLVGVDTAAIQWQRECGLALPQMSCSFTRPQENAVVVRNPFSLEVQGTVKVELPDRWTASPMLLPFSLAPGETAKLPFLVQVPSRADVGEHPIKLHFRLTGQRTFDFEVNRQITLSPEDVEVHLSALMNAQGDLMVEQRFVNLSDRAINFRCHLFAPGRKRMQTDLVDIARGENVYVFKIPNGADLAGKELWLRVEELDGPRIMNYRLIVD